MADDVEQITGNLARFRRLGGGRLNEMTSDLRLHVGLLFVLSLAFI